MVELVGEGVFHHDVFAGRQITEKKELSAAGMVVEKPVDFVCDVDARLRAVRPAL
jgi:hypothetical protein